MERLKIPGVAIGFITGDEEFTAGLGITSIENPLEVTPETLFQIGSTTKTITSTAVFRLIEQGKLSLDDLVRKHIPDFKVQDEDAAARATVRNLLDHSAGWQGDFFLDTGAGDDALLRYIEKMADLPQQTPLGAIYTYNNASFNVAGRIIEIITGATYEEAIHELVLEPLEMANSFFSLGKVMLRRFVVGHNLKGDEVIIAKPWEMNRAENACGGLVSDARDQLKYARFHMGDGTDAKGERLLTPESLKLMQTPTGSAGGDGQIGLTWFIHDIDDVRFISHGGSSVGQESAFWIAPEQGVALTVLTNQEHGTVLHETLTKWVQEHFLGVIEKEPAPLSLPDEALEEYAGSYVLTVTGDIFEFKRHDAGFITTHIVGDHSSMTDTPSDPYPPSWAMMIDRDRFLFLDEPLKGLKGEFLRDQDGKIAWVRFGGRILVRQV